MNNWYGNLPVGWLISMHPDYRANEIIELYQLVDDGYVIFYIMR